MSSNYPPGTSESDPRAPWNQPDPVECPECHGTGFLPADERQLRPEATECPRCDGEGVVDPREEDEGPDPDDLRDRELDDQMNPEPY